MTKKRPEAEPEVVDETTVDQTAETPTEAATDTSAEPEAQQEAAPEVESEEPVVDDHWASVLIVAEGSIPADESRAVIVVETRDDLGNLDEGRIYPTGADLYYRTSPEIDFGEGRVPLVTLGQDVLQGGLWGLSTNAAFIHVGPASPIYGAINLAYQRGAKTVDVVGLTQPQKEHLAPWIAHFHERGVDPNPHAEKLAEPFGLKVNLS